MGPPSAASPSSAEATSTGGCPVKHDSMVPNSGGSSPTSSSWNPLRWGQPVSPSAAPLNDSSRSTGGCPVKHTGGDANMGAKHIFGVPASVEEAAKHPQSPLPDQVVPLSTHRVVSSIPRGPGEEKEGSNQKKAPQHQPSDGKNWVYPSEQQFYNAMRRKGWVIDDEATVPEVVQIHNAVNERGWHQVRNWEETLHGNTNPRLVKFLGRPKDTSPKAFFNTWFLGYHAPFDRHDWYIDRNDGRSEPIRYVIDFYSGNETNTSFTSGEQKDTLMKRPPAMYLDVRPAIDSPEALVDRIQMFARDAFPGITAAFASSTQNSTNTSPHHDKDTTPSSK